MLQEHDKQADGAAEEDQVIAFLEEEMRKNPPRLDFKGFQALVRAFCQLVGVHTEKASPHALCKLITMQPCR